MILDTETFLYHITPAQVVCQLEVLVEHTVCIYVLKFEESFNGGGQNNMIIHWISKRFM